MHSKCVAITITLIWRQNPAAEKHQSPRHCRTRYCLINDGFDHVATFDDSGRDVRPKLLAGSWLSGATATLLAPLAPAASIFHLVLVPAMSVTLCFPLSQTGPKDVAKPPNWSLNCQPKMGLPTKSRTDIYRIEPLVTPPKVTTFHTFYKKQRNSSKLIENH